MSLVLQNQVCENRHGSLPLESFQSHSGGRHHSRSSSNKSNCRWHDQGPGAQRPQPLQEDHGRLPWHKASKQRSQVGREQTLKEGSWAEEGGMHRHWNALHDMTLGDTCRYICPNPQNHQEKPCINYRPWETVMCHSAGGGWVWEEGIWELCVLPVQFHYVTCSLKVFQTDRFFVLGTRSNSLNVSQDTAHLLRLLKHLKTPRWMVQLWWESTMTK